jgi:hypothetical protein
LAGDKMAYLKLDEDTILVHRAMRSMGLKIDYLDDHRTDPAEERRR